MTQYSSVNTISTNSQLKKIKISNKKCHWINSKIVIEYDWKLLRTIFHRTYY